MTDDLAAALAEIRRRLDAVEQAVGLDHDFAERVDDLADKLAASAPRKGATH